mmetsp:Transcript_90104/g.176411  ORF Transcript_90104/g.176411 Transcript_90104/m.176411 type:complete len:261 (-) Transcript_90104:174-956(-)
MGAQQSADKDPSAPQAPPSGAAPAFGATGFSGASSSARAASNKVELAVSVLGGVSIPGLTAYHSSVVVNGEEFFFSDAGISADRNMMSHKNPQNPKSTPTIIDMGMSQYSGSQLKAALERYFLPGTYDLLRKNCNSFSDCAMWYLTQKRIDSKYRALEKMGASMQSAVTAASGGEYKPNPKAEGFDVEVVCKEIDPEKVWTTPGQATGGAPAATSVEAMRAARLARLGGGGGAVAPGEVALASQSAPPVASSTAAPSDPL